MKTRKTRKSWRNLCAEIQEGIVKNKITANDLIKAGISRSAAYRALNGGLKNYNRTAESIRAILDIDIWETEKSEKADLTNLLHNQIGLVLNASEDQAEFIIEMAKLVERYSIKKFPN